MPLILISAAGTMFLGVLGAVSSTAIRRILAIHVISQVGYMILGVGLATELAVAATVLYMVQHMIVKCSLFLCCGLIEGQAGTDELARLGGLAKRDVPLAVLFFIAAMSLVGLPPLSGFFGKFLLVKESFAFTTFRGGWILAGIAVATGVLTLVSMAKIWTYAFWSPTREHVICDVDGGTLPRSRGGLIVTGALVALALSVGLGAQFYLDVARVAARNVLDRRDVYVTAVLGPDEAAVAAEPVAFAGDAPHEGVLP